MAQQVHLDLLASKDLLVLQVHSDHSDRWVLPEYLVSPDQLEQ